jgi:general secretion pathway protein A
VHETKTIKRPAILPNIVMTHLPLMNAASATPPKSVAPPNGANDRAAQQKIEPQPISGVIPKLLYELYGIVENPFGVTPDPRYLYQSKTHAEARSSLIIGIECGMGFQALIAPPGMGKTTTLLHVLERFKDVARTALLFQIHGDSRDFLRYLLSELGSDAPDSSVGRLQDAINQLLVREYRSGRRTIIVIDEAQGLDTPLLETIRLLSNFETRSEKLLQIILAGQPQLAERLANPELAQLHQRISILTKLIPFGLEDTSNYIEHRLTIAGYKGPPLFTSAALRLIWERSGGVPREINTLCFNALLLARSVEQKRIDSTIVLEVVADFDLDRFRLNTYAPPSHVQTTSGLSLENPAEDPLATSNNKSCKAAVPAVKTEAEDTFRRPTAFDRVDLVPLRTIKVEIVSTSSEGKVEQAAVPAVKTEAEDTFRRPTAFDRVDLVPLGTIKAETVSTSSEEKVEHAPVPVTKTEAEDTSRRPTAFDGVDQVPLGTIKAETVSTSSEEKVEHAPVPITKTEAEDTSRRPTAFDGVDQVQLGTIEAEIASASPNEKVEHAPVPVTKTEAEDTSRRPTAFDGVDQVQLGTIKAEIVSASSKEKVEQAVVLGAKTKADEASTQPSASEVDLFHLGEKASRRDSTNLEKQNEQAAASGAGTKSYDIVGGSILPDGPTWAWSRKTDIAIFAPTGITDAASRETEVAGSSTDDLQAMIENLAAKMEGALKEKHDLSSGVQSALTVPEPGSGVESTPEVEPGIAAEGALRSILAEKDAVFETDHQPLWKAATKLSRWPKQQWEMHRSKIYLGTSVLIFLLVLTLPQRFPETNLTIFKELSLNLGLAAAPSMPVPDDHPDAGVWVDLHTGLYYCSGTETYGKTGEGKFTTQRQAREEHFKPANSNVCQ